MASEPEADCITLDALCEEDLRSITLNPRYSLLLSELLGNEHQPEDTRPDNSLGNSSEGSVADPTTLDKQQEGLAADSGDRVSD